MDGGAIGACSGKVGKVREVKMILDRCKRVGSEFTIQSRMNPEDRP
jgi:hypothetical protein